VSKEALARIKINKLLVEAKWRFFDDENGKANIQLEPNVKIEPTDIDELGENFEKTRNGYVDYLLLDEFDKPAEFYNTKKIRTIFRIRQKTYS